MVVAMAEKKKGDKVVSFSHTFGRKNDGSTNHLVSYPRSSDIEGKTEYIIDISANGKTDIDTQSIDPFSVKTHGANNTSFSIPLKIIEGNGILPGHNVTISVYEIIEQIEDFPTDDASVIDRTTVTKDTTASDGCRSTLTSSKLCEYLGDATKVVKLRNISNGEETLLPTYSLGSQYRVTFPKEARKDIDSSPGDFIEIIKPPEDEEGDMCDSEKIDKMYEMISELYDAHTAAKND